MGLFGRMFATGASPSAASASVLSGVLGPGVSTIGKALGGRLGFNVAPLLAVAAPAVLRMISTTAKEQKLNSADIAKMLQQEEKTSLGSVKPDVQAVVNEAFQLGDRAEELKAKFSDADWNKIRMAPLAVTLYVITSAQSGFTGTSKEVIAAGEAMQSRVKDALPTSLVDVAFGSFDGKLDLMDGLDEKAPRTNMLAVVRDACAAVKATSPADAQAFTETLVTIAEKVAEASKEGGFLGIGGTRVSEQETHAIADIRSAVA
jgi:hypothetical protein